MVDDSRGRSALFNLPSIAFLRRVVACAAVLSAWAGACPARVVINEVYYDHPGADAGHEFVELINDSIAEVDFSGAALEFHNGTGTTWSLVWRAPAGTTIAGDALFVVGAELVVPPADAVVALALQNGPDAIRLVAADGAVLDVVGYGGLDDAAYVETLAVPPVAAGKSIARAMDAVDTDDNSVDFVAAQPTPAQYNVARHDVSLRLDAGTPVRGARSQPGTERMTFVVANDGLVSVEPGAVRVVVVDSNQAGVATIASQRNQSGVPPGAAERVMVSTPLGPGYHWIRVDAEYESDEREGNDTVRMLRRASRIPVLVSEVWSAPRDGCPQFVEWMNAGPAPVDVTGYTLRDERARPVMVDADSLVLGPGEWLALTADVERLAACVPGAPRARIVGVRGAWPTFNRSGGAVADSVVVFDRYGIVVDVVSYPAMPSSASGRSLERIDLFPHDGTAVWRLSDAPGGCSPGLANRAFIDHPAPLNEVVVSPNPFAPWAGEVLRVAVNPTPPVARVDAWVFDLDGHRIAALGGSTSFPALLIWDGRRDGGDLARPGIYVVACESFDSEGTRVNVQRVVVGCANRTGP